MARITPRTCLWPLVGCLCITFALSIGLTYSSDHHCYAGTCGEWLFPLQARTHVVVWYLWISLSVTFLAFRAFQPRLRGVVSRPLGVRIRLVNKQLRVSGLMLVLWIAILYGIIIGVWWKPLSVYFQHRGRDLPRNNVVAAVALTGHFADVTMGMVLLPVSRHSALASFLKLSPSTTYLFHMTQAYVLFVLVAIHASLYAAWAASYSQNASLFRHVLPVLNPTYLYHEVWPGNQSALGTWRASLIFSGIMSSLIMVLILFTSLPAIRRKHFNVFYFTHLLSVVAVVVICLHASTMFYCTVPGLSMWLLDWSMRFFELRDKLDGRLRALGNGWYTLTVALPCKRVSGCACHSPLAHFYIHHSASSIREIHPFTTVTHLGSEKAALQDETSSMNVEFLFRQSVPNVGHFASQPTLRKSTQWTHRLGSLVDEEHGKTDDNAENKGYPPVTQVDPLDVVKPGTDVKVRLEGPYFTPANPELFETVVCLVAGTGLSGAIAIAAAFKSQRHGKQRMSTEDDVRPSTTVDTSRISASGASKIWKRCVVVWTVRDRDYVDMSAFKTLSCEGLEFRVHRTGGRQGRPDGEQTLKQICGGSGPNTWCYISGPNGYIAAMEQACSTVAGLTWFAARWD